MRSMIAMTPPPPPLNHESCFPVYLVNRVAALHDSVLFIARIPKAARLWFLARILAMALGTECCFSFAGVSMFARLMPG